MAIDQAKLKDTIKSALDDNVWHKARLVVGHEAQAFTNLNDYSTWDAAVLQMY